MQRSFSRFVGLSLAVVILAGLAAGCGGSSSSSSSSTEASGTEAETTGGGGEPGTVSVDVGEGQTVEYTTGPLTIGVFLPGQVNQALRETWEGAKNQAAKEGAKAVLYESEFDPTVQLHQIQNAIQQGSIDAAIVEADDSNVVCNAFSKEAPEAGILVSVAIIPLCEKTVEQEGNSPEELWQPGTLNYSGSNNYVGFMEKWFQESAKAIPGKQVVVPVVGQATIGQTLLVEKALENFEKENSEFEIADVIYTNYETTDAFNKTQAYLQAHPETTVMMSINSPDTTEGILKAIEAAGLEDQIEVVDLGLAGPTTTSLIKEGKTVLGLPYFSASATAHSVESLVKAQSGEKQPRYIDDSFIGSVEEPFVVTKATLPEFEKARKEFEASQK
jgi:ribose transport system substrate-binding protein